MIDNEKLVGFIEEGIKASIDFIKEEYGKEDIYILSVEADNNNTPDGECSFGMYVNTEENHAKNMEDPADDEWYYRFCEYEWYPVYDSDYFKEATEYLESLEEEYEIEDVYECVVEAVEKLREEEYFDIAFNKFVFFSVCASDYFDEEGMIEFAVRMNGEENCKDYIDNTESFL